ncbi:MAG: FAD-binding oxidoreductase, partial [Geminicoccaceae bacterium]|nr:FAD-binding oxidoreductase [Geminicoccaceae bacterium]
MPGPQVVRVEGDATLPQRVDVVVIGGGIVGSSTAFELADRGVSVALCEKGGIGEEQSSRNWGWVRITRRDEREIPLMVEALRSWSSLGERTGRDTGFTRAGIA